MKKYWKYIAMFAVAATMMPLTACDDEVVDPYDINYAYLYQPNQDYSSIEFKISGNLIDDLQDTVSLVPVRLTKPAPKDITLSIEIDPTIVDEYNTANGTDCDFFSTAKILTPTMNIARGEYISLDSIKVDLSDKSCLEQSTRNMVLPIVIKSASGGAQVSKSSRLFMVFTYSGNIVTTEYSYTFAIDAAETGWETLLADTLVKNFVKASWAAEYPITINVEVDNNLVSHFNHVNGYNYKAIEATVANTVTLAEGKTFADLPISIADYSGIANDEGFVIPLKLSLGDGNGAILQSQTSFIVIKKLPLELVEAGGSNTQLSVPSDWTQIPFDSSWSGFKNGDEDISAILKNGDDFISFSTGDQVVIDLGSTKTVKGLMFHAYDWYYGLYDINNVQISNDGTNWSDVRGVTMDGYYGYYSYKYQNVAFSKPAKFRYFRFNAGDYSYSPSYGCYLRQIAFYE